MSMIDKRELPRNCVRRDIQAILLAVAFPDLKYTRHDIVAEGDKVGGITGTHKQELMGIAPTGGR